MRPLVRRHLRYFLLATAAALALRLLFLWKLKFVAGDSFIYGDLAKNWLLHGTYALTEDGLPIPSYIRLPGYPALIALIWKIVGPEHYTAVCIAQVFFDLGTCYLLGALARITVGERAALAAFLIYALNPFTANYAATPLAETLAVFFTVLALLCAVHGLEQLANGRLGWWLLCGLAVAAGILIRPDGGILLAGIGLYLLMQLFTRPYKRQIVSAGLVLAAVSLAPLVPWTLRNWRVLDRFEPLAPRYANNPDEFVPAGFNRWIKTWLVDYVSVEDIYWHVPGDKLDVSKLPPRAFDSPAERAETERLFTIYNSACDPFCHIVPELDRQFAQLAAQRIHRSLLRYYAWLPLLRITDMWLRPRTEALPLDPHWWSFRADPRDASISILLGTLSLALVIAAAIGVRRRRVPSAGLFILWMAMRCAFLATLENPETRYTLECLPVAFLFAAANAQKSPEESGQG